MDYFMKYLLLLLSCSTCMSDTSVETPDPGGSASELFPTGFDPPSDFFEPFPYFPDFGDVFRLSTTAPSFRFSDYDTDRDTSRRRPSRRPPGTASSRSKPSKQVISDPKDKPRSGKPSSKPRNYPKIFRFTSDRVNLADFDSKKKMNENYLTLNKGDELDSDKVKRNKFLILHGGVFEIEQSGRLLHASSGRKHEEDNFYGYATGPDGSKVVIDSDRYLYKV